MDLERERGITIKHASRSRSSIARADGEIYQLNLIDTPGHVDFSYEVSRSLAACEGALLIIDAAQGIEAQTLANYHLALEHDLTIIPVINKIDLPAADPERVMGEVEELLVMEKSECILASAKNGIGIEEILEAIVTAHSAAQGASRPPARAGLQRAVRSVSRRRELRARRRRRRSRRARASCRWRTSASSNAPRSASSRREMRATAALELGNVGYVIANIKSLGDIDVGDTITSPTNPAHVPLAGYRKAVPMVYCGLYPNEGASTTSLRDALEKLKLNDAALVYEPESSVALGFGFRCGFLGLLHMEIVQERLERDYGLDLIATSPSVGLPRDA